MKQVTKILMVAGCLLATISVAQDGDKNDRGRRRHGDRGNQWGGMMGRGAWGGTDMIEARKRMEDLRKEADKDGDGKLSGEERRNFFQGMRDAWQTHREEFMAKWDKNGDGEIDDEEQKAVDQNKLDEEFNHYDTNKDGVISKDEFKAGKDKEHEAMDGMRNLWRGTRGNHRENNDAEQGTIERFDENGDGTVDEAEKRKAAEAILKRMEDKGLTGSWKKFDRDGDGVLNGTEREDILKNLIERLERTPDKTIHKNKAGKPAAAGDDDAKKVEKTIQK